MPRLAGWWGHNPEPRFQMPPEFDPQTSVLGWQLSNAPVLSMAAHKASLDIFTEAGMQRIREKSLLLTGYLRYLIDQIMAKHTMNARIITPPDEASYGAQVSLDAGSEGKQLYKVLTEKNVVADWREPSVIRMAPAPLYNSFEDVYRFGTVLDEVLGA
jgi:kynureninase